MNPSGRSNSSQPKGKSPAPVDRPENLRLTHNYRSMAASYDAKRYDGPVQEFRLAHALETIERLIQPDPQMKILDVATGTGKGALCLAASGARVVGLDFTPAMLEILRNKAQTTDREIQLVRGSAAALPFSDGEFDAVVNLNFMHLFPPVTRQRVFAQELHRVLRPGGRLVVELINLYQGGLMGLYRKRFVEDLGFNAPSDISKLLEPEFEVNRIEGGHFPGAWRLLYPLSKISPGASRRIAQIARYRPWKYLTFNCFIQATRR